MDNSSLQKQFIGQSRLCRLLLWKVGDSTDIEQCLDTALESSMLSEDDVAFLLKCMDVEEASREGEPIDMDIDEVLISRLRRCVDKLNRADCA